MSSFLCLFLSGDARCGRPIWVQPFLDLHKIFFWGLSPLRILRPEKYGRFSIFLIQQGTENPPLMREFLIAVKGILAPFLRAFPLTARGIWVSVSIIAFPAHGVISLLQGPLPFFHWVFSLTLIKQKPGQKFCPGSFLQ